MNNKNIKDIQNELKKYVFGQDDLIKSLSVIAWTHQANQDRKNRGINPINNKTLIIGPSGCGKTYSVKKLASILGTKFIEIDCSKLQGNNYTGVYHSYDMFDSAIATYGHEAVENGIIFLDEFDKTLDVYSFKRYGSRHVQRDLLKIFEGDNIETKNHGTLNTQYMTIICAGSFYEGADASMYNDCAKVTKMGFSQNNDSSDANDHVKFNFTIDDLIGMGHLPELMGRFARIVNMNMLTDKDIVSILKNGENQIREYKDQFFSMGIDLDFTDNYYNYLSKNVSISKTGFRDVNKLICDDIDDIIIRLNSKIVKNVIVDVKKNDISIYFKDMSGHVLDRLNKPIQKVSQTHIPSFHIGFDLD